MKQASLLDWIDTTKSSIPSEAIQHRAFVVEQLKPVMQELEALELSPLAISEALAHYHAHFQTIAQDLLIKGN